MSWYEEKSWRELSLLGVKFFLYYTDLYNDFEFWVRLHTGLLAWIDQGRKCHQLILKYSFPYRIPFQPKFALGKNRKDNVQMRMFIHPKDEMSPNGIPFPYRVMIK